MIQLALALVVVLGAPVQALACSSVAACVKQARATPRRFTPGLRELLSRLPATAKLAGLELRDPNALLESHVRVLVLEALEREPPRSLTPEQLRVLSTRLLAERDRPQRQRLLQVLASSAAGKGWLNRALHGGEIRLATECALLLAWDAQGARDRLRSVELIWRQYQQERLVEPGKASEPYVGHFIMNHPELFAARLRASLLASIEAGHAPNPRDLDYYASSDRRPVLEDLVRWAEHRSPAVASAAGPRLLNQVTNLGDGATLPSSLLAAARRVASAQLASRTAQQGLRIAALCALDRLHELAPEPAWLTTLSSMVGDRDAELRRNAISILARVARVRPADRPRVQPALARAFRDPSPGVVETLVRSLDDLREAWIVAALTRFLRGAPKERFRDPLWQHVIVSAGASLERRQGARYGFAPPAAARRPVRCGTGRLMEAHALATDLKIFGLEPEPVQAPPSRPAPTRAEQEQERERTAARLLSAVRKLPAAR